MGMIQKKNSEDFFMMVLPETRGTHRMPVPESGVSLFWNVDSVLPNRGWNGHSQWSSRQLVHLTFHSHTTLPSPLMCFLPDWQRRQSTSQAYTLWPRYKKLGPCPQRNTWPRGSPSTNTDNNQYPRAPDYSNSTISAVDGLHGWDLLLLFRLDTHIFMCPLYFIAGKNNQRRANNIPYLVFRGTEVGWSPCLEEPGTVLQIHLKMDPLLFNIEQPSTEH